MEAANRAFDRLLFALAAVSGGIVAAIALVIPVNVVSRNLFDTPVYGALEAIEYGLLASTFLAAPWVLSINAHVRVDLVTSALPPRPRRVLATLTCLLGAGVSAVLGWYGTEALLASYARGSMVRTAFTFPEWLTLLALPVSMALITLEFLRQPFRPPEAAPSPPGL